MSSRGTAQGTAPSTTRHPETERLSAWISGDLSERETAVVRAHVEVCPHCMNVAAELREQIVATRSLDRPEPPPTLWSAIEGALETPPPAWRRWSWPATLTGALAGAAAVAALTWGLAHRPGGRDDDRDRSRGRAARQTAGDSFVASPGGKTAGNAGGKIAGPMAPAASTDPLLAEAERELEQAALSYERAADRLRKLVEREQVLWDPETRARVGARLARLDEAVAHSRAVARRDPGDSTGADMLFSAYQRQIAFLAEVVHRGSPASGEGLP